MAGITEYSKMFKFVQDLLTENDNTTWCIARVAFAIALGSYIAYSIYGLYENKTCDLTAFATGITLILGSGATGIALKSIKST